MTSPSEPLLGPANEGAAAASSGKASLEDSNSGPVVTGAFAGRVGAVIVAYQSGDDVARCITSLRAQGVANVVVVDNGSSDGSLDALPLGTHVVRLGSNLGYGAAANVGARVLGELDVLVVNPDVSFRPNALATLLSALDDPTVGLVGPAQFDGAGREYPAARVFPNLVDGALHALLGKLWPSNPGTRRVRTESYPLDQPADVDWVSGAAMLVRRAAWRDVAGFDPRYFLYFEDVDICWRLARRGWIVRYEPRASIVHVGAGSTSGSSSIAVIAHHKSAWRFVRMSTKGWRRLLLPVVGAGLVGRAAVGLVRARFGRR